MATYAIGDVQGCYDELMQLLERVRFDPAGDTLWFVGDLVNRGPASLEVLRFVHGLGDRAITVLGNHDLHLLAVAYGERQRKSNDTLDAVLAAHDRETLLQWLRSRPLLHIDDAGEQSTERPVFMSHAGLPPIWSIERARELAVEVEEALRSDRITAFLRAMYGNTPDRWRDDVEGMTRLRVITNYLTRMRVLTPDGRLNLRFDGPAAEAPHPFRPWFEFHRDRQMRHALVFGHWAALEGKVDVPGVFALDTGCAWGGSLTALRLQDWTRFCIRSIASVRRRAPRARRKS
jgi:bis(5'-nucleosyl)-tetraphosphatase (symmetrical)